MPHGTRHSRHGSIRGCGTPCPTLTPPTAAEAHIVTREMQAVRARRETLNNMETMRQDRNGDKLTTMGAVDEISEAATDTEALYDATAVAKTHLGLKE